MRINQDQLLMVFLLLVAIASGLDIVADVSEGTSKSHLIQESVLLMTAIGILVWLVNDYRRKKDELEILQKSLSEIQRLPSPNLPQVNDARRQLGQAIVDQFEQWNLTASERDVGMLLLKGFSLREIATLRGTAEKTIRQQASTIYQKSGLPGRHAFSAWFIEDLLIVS